jgi:hypothetical protein
MGKTDGLTIMKRVIHGARPLRGYCDDDRAERANDCEPHLCDLRDLRDLTNR